MEGGQQPRIAPGNRRQIGPVNAAIAWVIARATGGRYVMTVMFTTLILRPEQDANYVGFGFDAR